MHINVYVSLCIYIWYYLHRYLSLYVNVNGYACKSTTISKKLVKMSVTGGCVHEIHDETYHFWTKRSAHIYMKCEVQSYLV